MNDTFPYTRLQLAEKIGIKVKTSIRILQEKFLTEGTHYIIKIERGNLVHYYSQEAVEILKNRPPRGGKRLRKPKPEQE